MNKILIILLCLIFSTQTNAQFGKLKKLFSKDEATYEIEYYSNSLEEIQAKKIQKEYKSPILFVNNSVFLIPEGCLCDRGLGGDKDDRSLGGDKDDRNLGGDKDDRNLGGDKDDRNLGGDKDDRNLGGDKDDRNLGGDKDDRNLGGDKDDRNLGGDKDDRNLGGDKMELTCSLGENCTLILNYTRTDISIKLIDDFGVRSIEGNAIELR